MGILTDFVLADPARAAHVAASDAPTTAWPGMRAKGIDPVKRSQLFALLLQRAWDLELANAITLAAQRSEMGPWVFAVPDALVERLASITAADVSTLASRWHATEEFALDGTPLGAVRETLNGLIALAREATTKRTHILLWMSL